MTQPVPQQHLCIIGLGLIGGSLAAALKAAGYDGHITAVVRNPATGTRAIERKLVDHVTQNVAEGVANADIVMLAVPMLTMREQLEALKDHVKPTAVITDAGSVKTPFILDARAVLGSLERVVPGHPIAGREKSGVDAAEAALFQQRRVLLTPTSESAPDAINTVSALWRLAGAEVEILSPEQHDRVLAATSHLPHVLAFALVDTLATQQEAEEIFRYAAGGFRDFTRIASSDAIMWRDVCLTNRTEILASIDRLDTHLQALRAAIDRGDGEAIEQTFLRAKQARDAH